MKKYDLANYINNKTAVIYTDESIFSQYSVIYYHQGKMIGYSTFAEEQGALEASVRYIKDDNIECGKSAH